MNSFEKLVQSFKKIDKQYKYLILICLILLFIALFYPKRHGFGVKLVPVTGSSYYQAVFEGFSSDDKVKKALENNKPSFVAFVTEWCGYCKNLKPIWQKFEDEYKGEDINVLSIDCDKYKELAKKYNIKGYPTIKYIPNGLNNPTDSVDYSGDKKKEEFFSFINNKLK